MKPIVVCENFEAPDDLILFMKEAIGEILRISPYDSYLEAYIRKELSEYLMTISIKYPDGQFSTTAADTDLRRVITQGTANIFTQVRGWWKSRFGQNSDARTDWAGDFAKSDIGQLVQDFFQPAMKIFGKNEQVDPLKKSLRVLIVDDDIESVTPLELCLEKLGCTTFVVNNGFEAIHEIVSNDRVYDVVILDWNMPEMTGGQALLNAQKVISFSPSANKHWETEKLSVITYSSRAREEIDLPDCRDFRHIDHWEKPASYLHLLDQATVTFAKLEASVG